MENFPYFSAVQTNACDTLWKLCLQVSYHVCLALLSLHAFSVYDWQMQDGNFHDTILKKGGLTRILTALQYHKDDARLVYSACGALRKLLACR